jgi:DNA invertase Pin-like site-specific DNA recombinase
MYATLYLRCSTREQAESGLGLEAQEAACRSFCEKNGLSITGIFRDEGISGSKDFTERPGLCSALSWVTTGKASRLVVMKLDRLSRDPLTLMTIERLLDKHDSKVVSAYGEGTDSDDPSAVLMRRILAAVAENELRLISMRTSAALQAKRARGERLGRPPYGTTAQSGKLVPSSDFDKVIDVVELRSEGKTLKDISSLTGLKLDTVWRIQKRWTLESASDFKSQADSTSAFAS